MISVSTTRRARRGMVREWRLHALSVFSLAVAFVCLGASLLVVANLRLVEQRWAHAGRASVYLRDGFRCCYCNERHPPEDLTYDHVVPRIQWRGSPEKLTDWENIVTACWDCNQRKGSRTPAEAGMKLLRKPFRPTKLPPLPFFWPKDPPQAWLDWQPIQANDVDAA